MSEHNYIVQSDKIFDAIVVGSGVTGGWAAKEFCEKGFETLMIERGRVVEHRNDYITEGKGPWEFPNRQRVNNLLVEQEQSVQKRCYAFNDATRHFFGNDRDLPYTSKPGTDFTWIRANQLGGKSLLWHRQSYRLCADDFLANKRDGHGNDWPIRYNDLEKYYSYVEEHVGVSGQAEGLDNLPDGVFQPAFEMTSPEKMLRQSIEENFPNRNMVMGRCAHLTKPTELQISQGRVTCQARSECQKGCSFGAYFSTQSSTLPAAAKTNKLSIAPNSVVHSLIYDEKTNRVRGVRVIDNDNFTTREYFAKVVFLCASTIGSTQIMLNSKSKKFPNGIANSSGVLGHYLMDHNYNAMATGEVVGFEDEYYRGRRPTGGYIPNFYYKPELYANGFKRGYAFGVGAYRDGYHALSKRDGVGRAYKESLTQAGPWHIGMWAQGEMLPRFENQVALHPTKTDKWGIPQLEFNCQWSDNEKAMMDDAAFTGEQMLKKAGLINVRSETFYHTKRPGSAIHEVGTARMGKDPKESVLNSYNQTHDIPNLFVSDGSAFCSSAVVNPSITFMAMTVRAVEFCVNEMSNRRI
uniref:GMC oxidoreductase n=1 Tax=Shewanella gaetbuli TaxID=220752 RepID=UPI003B59238A